MKISISQIVIGERQRQDLGNIDELADSMARIGQIHNIGLTSDNKLIWGRRRLAAATSLGWTEIEATVRDGLGVVDEQELELEEDIRRKSRTWQEEVISVAKLFALHARKAREVGQAFGYRDFSERYPMFGKSVVQEYVNGVAVALLSTPRDEAVWNAENYERAFQIVRARVEQKAYDEMQARQKAAKDAIEAAKLAKMVWRGGPGGRLMSPEEAAAYDYGDTEGSVHKVDPTLEKAIAPLLPVPVAPVKRLTLFERAQAYNTTINPSLPNSKIYYETDGKRELINGFWFVGGGNISDFYGSYQTEYIRRITTLFPDIIGKQEIVHLFSGSIPVGPNYTVVGLTDANNPPDVVCNAENLSSGLGFNPTLIYADPPYSIEDSEHYANSMVNRPRVVEECGIVLKPGGFLVWLDQALPVFSNEVFELVGAIGYVRSTGNRFRMITILRKRGT